ncbi:hypothetical protein CC79DRAFT_1392559 [Sarocladium strictum]
MKFTAVFTLAMASVAMAAPTDYTVDVVQRTDSHPPSTPPPAGSPCGDNRVVVHISQVTGLIGLIGDILNGVGGGAFCCDSNAPQVGLINISALNCVKIL